jgi:hypothetical protein
VKYPVTSILYGVLALVPAAHTMLRISQGALPFFPPYKVVLMVLVILVLPAAFGFASGWAYRQWQATSWTAPEDGDRTAVFYLHKKIPPPPHKTWTANSEEEEL